MRLVSFVICVVIASSATAAEYQSHFGYSIQMSDDWLVLTPNEVAKFSADTTPQSIGLSGVPQAELQATLEQVKSGQVEFYFDRKYSTRNWNNNISAQMKPARGESIKELAKQCPGLTSQIRAVYGPSTKVTKCGEKTTSGVAYLAYEYEIPSERITIIQHEIPYGLRGTLILVGGSNPQGLKQLKSAQDHVTTMAVKQLKAAKQ
ncbi:MAG: hypothetical protein H6943_03265 [Zoogloeaceae bacterium]|nr:hypothetical protein [Zoogloeaceae bacterium]